MFLHFIVPVNATSFDHFNTVDQQFFYLFHLRDLDRIVKRAKTDHLYAQPFPILAG